MEATSYPLNKDWSRDLPWPRDGGGRNGMPSSSSSESCQRGAKPGPACWGRSEDAEESQVSQPMTRSHAAYPTHKGRGVREPSDDYQTWLRVADPQILS